MSDIKKFVVPWLHEAGFYSIQSVDDVEANPEWARMSINECPLPPSEKIVNAVAEAARKGNRYPGTPKALQTKIANLFGLDYTNVWFGNGSSELIDATMRIFVRPGDEVVIHQPAFSMYGVRVSVCGGVPIDVPMKENYDFDIDSVLAAVTEKTKVIMITNPNNPSGTFISDEDMIRVFETGKPIFFDEAYLEFSPDRESKAQMIKKYPNVMVYHTLSKAYGLAGLRFGYVLADPEVINYFKSVVITWNNSWLNMAAAEAAIDDQEELAKKVNFNNTWVKYFCEELGAIKGVKPYMSHGNYVLVDATDTGKTADQIHADALANNYQLKKFKPHHTRDGVFRITIGTEEQNQNLATWLKGYFG